MKKHILAVDDEADIRELLREVLTLKGYRVSTAAEPEAAKKIIQQDPPQLIILDLQFQEGDGLELLEDIKRMGQNIPVVLMTGALFDRGAVRDTVEKKVSLYLDKTTPLSTIVAEIQRLLGDSPASQSHV